MSRVVRGDSVRLRELPPWANLASGLAQEVLRASVGRVFRVTAITEDGLVQLDISEFIDPHFGTGREGSFLRVPEDCIETVAPGSAS